MLADFARGTIQETAESSVLGSAKISKDLNIVIAIMLDGIKDGNGFQIPASGMRLNRSSLCIVLAIRLGSFQHEITPTHVILMQQIGQIGPGVDRCSLCTIEARRIGPDFGEHFCS